MKPLSLEFTAFGSYPGTNTIAFDSLTQLGLYVVTGPTGSGKTTIFDAMAYALFGEVPGVRDKSDIRSQHAEADATCSVIFRFEINEIVYRVERTPEQFKPRKRGGGSPVKVTAKASLVRESDGIALESGATKVAKACVDLVGLDAKQFERVILLPQGRFQQFLLADTATRLPLLRQLFGTGKWLTVVDELKANANEAGTLVAEIEDQLRQHLFAINGALGAAEALLTPMVDPAPENHADSDSDSDSETETETETDTDTDTEDDDEGQSIERLTERLAQIDEQLTPLNLDAQRLLQIADAALGAHTEALSIISNWDKRVQLREERRLLDEQYAEHERLRAQCERARDAEPVLRASDTAHRDATSSRDAIDALENLTAKLREAAQQAELGDLSDPDSVADALAVARTTNASKLNTVKALTEAADLVTRLQGQKNVLEVEHSDLARRAEEISDLLVEYESRKAELEASAATVPERDLHVERLNELLRYREELAEVGEKIPAAHEAQAQAYERQREAIKAFDDSAAPRLAESLVDGEPCPVCGSSDHPVPAPIAGDEPIDSSDRDNATKALMNATQELDRLGNRQEQLLAALGETATRSIAQIAADREQAMTERQSALDAKNDLLALVVQIDTTKTEHTSIGQRTSAVSLELAGIEPQIAAAERSVIDLRTELGELAVVWQADPQTAMQSLNSFNEALDRVEVLVGSCRAAAQEVTAAVANAEASSTALTELLRTSSFATIDDAQAAAIDSDQRTELESIVESFDTRSKANQTLLQENLKLTLPDQRPDATDLERRAHETRATADAASNALSQISGHVELARSNLHDAEAINAGSGEAIDRRNELQSLAKTCDGQGPKRIALETWVLAGELERVAAAANHHLEKMTNGRYRIERSDDSGHGGRQSGLDLRVLDAHTGASRRPGSLSGGEQFQASLALALGLADVIGHGGTANGRVFEALFVDEGFGSLDPDSLDQAVDALSKIQASGRTVGVITHVEAMKESLPIGIRVDRLADGKGSTLTVLPNN